MFDNIPKTDVKFSEQSERLDRSHNKEIAKGFMWLQEVLRGQRRRSKNIRKSITWLNIGMYQFLDVLRCETYTSLKPTTSKGFSIERIKDFKELVGHSIASAIIHLVLYADSKGMDVHKLILEELERLHGEPFSYLFGRESRPK